MVGLTERWGPLLAAVGLACLLTACDEEPGSGTAAVATVPPAPTAQPAVPTPPVQPTATSLPATPTASPLPPTATTPPTATAAATLPPTTTPRPTATSSPTPLPPTATTPPTATATATVPPTVTPRPTATPPPTPPPPTATPAPVALKIVAYAVPPGSRPHDVAPAPDGRVWYTAQGSGELGVLDPATGNTHHIPLGGGSAPHGVIVGPDGAPWITDGGLNAIVRVDPASEEVQRFPLPAGTGYANLNTATFDRQGLLWFTGQSGVYGRLNPGERGAGRLPGTAGPWPLRHRHDSRRAGLLRLAGWQLRRPD